MATASDSDLLLRVPEASSVASDVRAVALSDAIARVSSTAYHALAVPAQCYYAGHILTIQGEISPGRGRGIVVSHSGGGASASYANPGLGLPGDGLLTTTHYGRLFLDLKRGAVSAPMFVTP